LGRNTVAIRWDFARQALQAATGMPTLVGLEANADASTAPSVASPARQAAAASPNGG
jgi:hypothetical protein